MCITTIKEIKKRSQTVSVNFPLFTLAKGMSLILVWVVRCNVSYSHKYHLAVATPVRQRLTNLSEISLGSSILSLCAKLRANINNYNITVTMLNQM